MTEKKKLYSLTSQPPCKIPSPSACHFINCFMSKLMSDRATPRFYSVTKNVCVFLSPPSSGLILETFLMFQKEKKNPIWKYSKPIQQALEQQCSVQCPFVTTLMRCHWNPCLFQLAPGKICVVIRGFP